MNHTLGRTRMFELAGLLIAAVAPSLAEEPQSPKRESAAAAAQSKAPSAAYIIEQNQDSQIAKREVPGGWREVNVKGVVYWCQENKAMGSRVKREARCLTPTQYDLLEEDSQRVIEDGRRNSLPPKGG